MIGWVLAVACLLAAAWTAGLAVSQARRLHRLHLRVDAARAGLEAALAGRAAAALAATGSADPVFGAVFDTRMVGAGGREAAENGLGRVLARLDRAVLPPVVREELAEAEQMLALARRVHNDAVRDTLELRSRRMVRLLHLAGAARLPGYFEIVDPADPLLQSLPL